MRSTVELRRIWGPECATQGQLIRITLHNGVRITARRECEEAVRALDAALARHQYHPRQADTAAMNCRRITGGTGLSLHSFGTAIDINWQSNGYGKRASTDMPPAMIAGIEAVRTNDGLRVWSWGGRWSTPDFMHFEVVASPAELAHGIRSTEDPPPPPQRKKVPDMYAVLNPDDGQVHLVTGPGYLDGVSGAEMEKAGIPIIRVEPDVLGGMFQRNDDLRRQLRS